MVKDCVKCNEDAVLRVAELEIENERLKDWRYMLEKSLETEQQITKLLREENEELQNKLSIYQLHCINNKEKENANNR